MQHPFDELIQKCLAAMERDGDKILIGRGLAGDSEMLVVVVRDKEAEALESFLEVLSQTDLDSPAHGGFETIEIAKPVQYEPRA